jgi:hypothetical protein
VGFQGDAPASPHKASTRKQSSVFTNFSAQFEFDSKMDELFGCTNTSLSKGTIEVEFERYVNGAPFSRETDIICFWEISFPYTIQDEHSQTR